MYSLSPKALGGLKRVIRILTGEAPEGPFEFDEQELVGHDCRIVLSKELYNDKTVNRVDDLVDPNEDEPVIDSRPHAGDSKGGQFDWSNE